MTSFSEMAAIGPPRLDQIEICVFGPNYGESIVLHLGNGNWVVVGSCIHADTNEPVSLAYSHDEELKFMKRIMADMPRSRKTKRAVPSPQPNHISIATMISVGTTTSALLGADVENSGEPTAGWEAILGAHNHSPLAPVA